MLLFQKIKQAVYKKIIFFYIRLSSPMRLKKRKTLRFETDITGHCNLNCKGCNHFSPLGSEYFVNPDEFERDLKRLSQLSGRKNENIDLMGGEPLLHPEISRIAAITRRYFDGPVNIITNGILLPEMNENFWQTCSKNKIKIIVTSYPVKLDKKLIRQNAKKYSVRLSMRKQIMNSHTWCKLPKDIQGAQDKNKNFKLCLVANFCISLKNGKMSACCLPLIAERFNNYFDKNFIVSDNDYIDIYKAVSIDEIYDFLNKPMPFCRYCKLLDWEVGIKWEVSRYEISEWLD